MDGKKIFILDDNLEFIKTLRDLLLMNSYTVDYALDPAEIDDYLELNRYDLILMDIMMESTSGLDYLKLIRSEIKRPILFISARDQKNDILEGLDIGADDYITKPFDNDLLLARIRSQLRRDQLQRSAVLEIKDLRLDEDRRQAVREEKRVQFSKNEFTLLWHLANHPQKTYTKEELLYLLDGVDKDSELRLIVQYIYQLRMKFSELGIDPIENIWGRGYRWSYQ
ncbi:MAG: response regulator transcription factor [Eubacteriales bacterium]|nr:response regulator transcription factor [Eubacteriales bacterium]